jgi:uncharacterized protein
MYVSRYTLIFRVNDENILFNPLSGAIDIANDREVEIIKKIRRGCTPQDRNALEVLLERGYVFQNEKEEIEALDKAFKKFNESRRRSRIKFFIIPTYNCNLRCTYCFQGDIQRRAEYISDRMLSQALKTASTITSGGESNQPPSFSIFGGEPLMFNPREYAIIKKILDESAERRYLSLIISNGVELESYLDLLSNYDTEIHVTIDGPREIHDKRRIFPNGRGSFDKIIRGISLALDVNLPISVRVNVDGENLNSLPKLAEFINDQGWNRNPRFKAYVALVRDYYCKGFEHCIYDHRFFPALFELFEEYPQTRMFDLPSWQTTVSLKHLLSTGKLYPPTFKGCTAGDNQYIFDLYGDIYVCLETCGDKEFSVGKFYPSLSFNSENLTCWEKRTIFNIDRCKKCPLALICGGGCALMAYSKGKQFNSPACLITKDAIESWFGYYLPELKRMGR